MANICTLYSGAAVAALRAASAAARSSNSSSQEQHLQQPWQQLQWWERRPDHGDPRKRNAETVSRLGEDGLQGANIAKFYNYAGLNTEVEQKGITNI